MANPPAAASPASLERRTSHVSGLLEGWTFTLAVAAAIAALTAAILWAGGTGAPAIGLALRATARTSFALFAAAFTASAVTAELCQAVTARYSPVRGALR